MGQLMWTRFPQGFKNSPTYFAMALRTDLLTFQQRYPESILLQYKDGLTDSETEEECKKVTEALLEALQALGHQVSAKKTQLFGALHHLLGYNLEDGKRTLAQG